MKEFFRKISAIKHLQGTHDRGSVREARRIEAAENLELLSADGKDSVVWRDGDSVIKIDKRVGEFSESAQRQIFYTHHILHILFPNNFLQPSVAVDCTGDSENSATKWPHIKGEHLSQKDALQSTVHAALQKLKKYHLRIQLDFVGTGNVLKLPDGRELYIDIVRNFIHSSADIDKIFAFMDAEGVYTDADRARIQLCGRRLIELQKKH